MRTGRYDEAELEARLDSRGFMNRILGPLTKSIRRPGQMFPLGFLFGIGFDTSTVRYRLGPDHRHHLICTECGLSPPVDSGPVEDWADTVARTSGFANVRHTGELSGVCSDRDRRHAAAERH